MSKNINFNRQYLFVMIIALVIISWLSDPQPSLNDSVYQQEFLSEHHPETTNLDRQQNESSPTKVSSQNLATADSYLTKNTAPPSGINLSFSAVEDALMMAKLNNFGALILDEQALISLNLVVSRLPENLTPQDIQKIQQIIMQALPGEAGEQVAEVLANYYSFKQAEKEWLKNGMKATSLQAAMVQLENIITLRRDYLGQEVANKLFSRQQQQASFALQKIAIQQNSNLSEHEKENNLAALKLESNNTIPTQTDSQNFAVNQLNNEVQAMRLAGATQSDIQTKRIEVLGEQAATQVEAMELQKQQWHNRYQQYQDEKQYILDSAMSEIDKQQQIETLLSTHYSRDELDGARAYDTQQIQ
jgi:lipase chaperone LimK